MSEECVEGVWWASGGCLEGALRVSGRCLEGVWRVSKACLNGNLVSQDHSYQQEHIIIDIYYVSDYIDTSLLTLVLQYLPITSGNGQDRSSQDRPSQDRSIQD